MAENQEVQKILDALNQAYVTTGFVMQSCDFDEVFLVSRGETTYGFKFNYDSNKYEQVPLY